METIGRTGSLASTAPVAASRQHRLQSAALVLLLAGVGLFLWPSNDVLPLALGVSVIVAGALPALVLARWPASTRVLAVAVAVAVVPAGLLAVGRATGSGTARYRNHDGGVYVTRAAATDILDGKNPYTDRFDRALPPSWQRVQGADGRTSPNPVIEHYPYLPAAALVQVPFVAASRLFGVDWDPRMLAWALLLAAALALARRPEPVAARAAAIISLGNAFTVLYLAWGTNDAQVAALVLLACLLARRRPALAGAALALAVSGKFLVLVAVPPLLYVETTAYGLRAALRRWWSFPATLLATIVPFLVARPAALFEDTVAFNLGLTKVKMPPSGIGLPIAAPGLFAGPVLAAVTVLGAMAALVLPLALVRRRPTLLAVPPATAVGLWFLLWPARTFQATYLTLLLGLVAPVWLLVGSKADRAGAAAEPGATGGMVGDAKPDSVAPRPAAVPAT
ncbi:MAG: hypothetical protein HYX34_10150 [Actinobacteria bacterium]|nr:hypothetical protein [Actinomycetota bacterium]